jgi:ATP-dependent exoDNAse (exonuclease V) beta subunit
VSLLRTELISASAGTGKTHRLAEELKRELLHPTYPIAPERVVAVTFTRAAAAELAARVRRSLLVAGEVSLARRLAAARIGTIHSVCARLVREHAFSLGLSPELHALDEHLTFGAVRAAIEQHISEDDRALLDDFDVKLAGAPGRSGFNWHAAVKEIIDAARGNGLGADDLMLSAQRSRDELAAVWPLAVDGAALERELVELIDKILAGPAPKIDDVLAERAALAEMRTALRRGEPVPWWSWLALGDSHMLVLRRFGAAHVAHPMLRADLDAAIRVVFDVAQRALRRYEEDKRAWGVFDFVDQETFALRLLRDASIREHLREQIGLVLVDEFQDTSPLQLAILTEIAKLANKTVFVGDQKQAIYGFRGTDPSLMETVVEALATTSTAPLDVSFRSRPGLVELTSSLFAPAFQSQGIPEERVRVTANVVHEAPGLGPILERWLLSDGRSGRELAAGIVELLEDETVRVREGDAVVAVRPRHVAVLARTNRHARDVADELVKAGVPAVLRRRGLCSTIEARALMAGLALFLDGRDALAAAELTRLTRGAADAGEWMRALVERGTPVDGARALPFVDDPYVVAVTDAARNYREAGIVLALDLVIESLRLRDCCASWGDSAQRLANLGALRALAVRFVQERGARGIGATLAGLLARLEELASSGANDVAPDDADDDQGDVAGQDAVDVVTWHKAKGREWPIVVLAQLVYQRPPRVTGVHVESSSALGVRLNDPLEGRWVRYWPSPYGEWQSEGGLLDVLGQHRFSDALRRAAVREELRLLYVGWTRARDRLVLPGPVLDPAWSSGGGKDRLDMWAGPLTILRQLADARGPLLSEPVVVDTALPCIGSATWAGVKVDVLVRQARLRPAPPPVAGERIVHAPLLPRAHAPAFLAPSALAETGELVGDPVVLGAPIALPVFVDEDTMALLGTAVHGFFAADPAAPHGARATGLLGVASNATDGAARGRLAERLLTGYGVRHLMQPGDLVKAGDRLWGHVRDRWPSSTVRREAPVAHRLREGTLVRGIIDVVVEHADGFAIIDHKTYAGIVPKEIAPSFAGQLRAYARALAVATHRPVTELVVHLPLSAAMVTVR